MRETLYCIKKAIAFISKELELKKHLLKGKQKEIQDTKKMEMGKWFEHHAENASKMSNDPWTAWQSAKTIAKGEFTHYKESSNIALQKADGSLAQTDGENAEILDPHLQIVYNSGHPDDPKLIEKKLLQCETDHKLDGDISFFHLQ